MKKISLKEAKEIFIGGGLVWTPIEDCGDDCEETHYTTIDPNQGDTLEDLEHRELFS